MIINRNYYFMCKASSELQKMKSLLFEDGDYFINMEQLDLTKDKMEAKLASSCRCFDTPINNTLKIWIPTQEQIQELFMKEAKISVPFLISSFAKDIVQKDKCWLSNEFVNFNSVEEIWLSFYNQGLNDLIWNFETCVWENKYTTVL